LLDHAQLTMLGAMPEGVNAVMGEGIRRFSQCS
jgi:hypothetical protein